MKNIYLEDLARLVLEYPDQETDMGKALSVMGTCIPQLADKLNIVYISAVNYDPPNRMNPEGSRRECVVYAKGETTSYIKKEYKYAIGNGGYAQIIMHIEQESDELIDQMPEYDILARLLYLLAGRSRAFESMYRLTFTDQLTGVANVSRLEQYIGQTRGMHIETGYVCNFMNIKNMKLLNNRYSQPVGNQILANYAKQIEAFIGQSGLIARLGGDNFVAFIENSRQDFFLTFMKNLAVSVRLQNGAEETVKLDTRIGYYELKSGDGYHEALRDCDIALRIAKSTNVDVVRFKDEMRLQMLRMKELEQSIPLAIANRELCVYFQPKVDITDMDNPVIYGAEALVRWKKNDRMIPPAEFIPLMESNGMIAIVDFYVLESICQTIKEWERKGYKHIKISSNFSRHNLYDIMFAEKVEKIIRKYDINPGTIEIEITESYDNEDTDALTIFEKRMHALGVTLSVDDFGSGFSSLKMVKDIVADTIKLDKSIIDGVIENNGDKIIVSHVIQMILALGKDIIAEGVELEEQAKFLRDNGCNKIQGFLYGRPMPEEDFEQLIKV